MIRTSVTFTLDSDILKAVDDLINSRKTVFRNRSQFLEHCVKTTLEGDL